MKSLSLLWFRESLVVTWGSGQDDWQVCRMIDRCGLLWVHVGLSWRRVSRKKISKEPNDTNKRSPNIDPWGAPPVVWALNRDGADDSSSLWQRRKRSESSSLIVVLKVFFFEFCLRRKTLNSEAAAGLQWWRCLFLCCYGWLWVRARGGEATDRIRSFRASERFRERKWNDVFW